MIPLCSEQLGGLSTPRPPSRIVDGNGYDVLDGRARVLTQSGEDVTENFIRGATEVLKIAEVLDVEEAILESKSPSCGCGRIYNGHFGESVERDGVLAALLRRNGIRAIPG